MYSIEYYIGLLYGNGKHINYEKVKMSKTNLVARYLSGDEGIKNILTLSGSIAHELKNYLAGIGICAELSEGRLRDISNICAELSEGKLKHIRQRVKAADYLIGNLQLQIKSIVTSKPSTKDFKCYPITKNIMEALEQYPFEAGERELITVEAAKDFKYNGNPVLTSHVLYNLIKNSLRAIKNTGKGKITIKLKSGVRYNVLVFRDTATGISKKFLSKIFKLFESQMTAHGGTGIGLAFCKLTMESYGGDIACNSIEGEYTEFVLKFPCVAE